jgi:glutathione S-transferase
MRLITIPMSHYCEKARWGLDLAGLEYTEEAHAPGLHSVFSYWTARTRFTPVLVTRDESIADSTSILRWLDARHSLELYPDGALALEERFDGDLGVCGRRWAYWVGLNNRPMLVEIAIQRVAPAEQAIFRMASPLIFARIRPYLKIEAGAVARGREKYLRELDFVAELLRDGRPYLLGDRFSAADLTFAALAAPLVLPREYSVWLPAPDDFPEPHRAEVLEHRAHPAGAFALRMFAEHRRKSATR